MERAGVVRLLQDGRHRQLRRVGQEARRPGRVPHAEHRRRREGGLERVTLRVEALLLCRTPGEPGAGATQGCEWGGEGGEAQHELTVVIGEADEAADVGALGRRGPLRDGRHLAWVDGDAPLRDDVAEEADRGADELALGGLGEELVVAQRLSVSSTILTCTRCSSG